MGDDWARACVQLFEDGVIAATMDEVGKPSAAVPDKIAPRKSIAAMVKFNGDRVGPVVLFTSQLALDRARKSCCADIAAAAGIANVVSAEIVGDFSANKAMWQYRCTSTGVSRV